MPKIIKPVRPTPYRSNSLWCGCKFALATGWPKGARSSLQMLETDDVSRSRGTFSSSLGMEHFPITDAGRMIDSNGGSDEILLWDDVGSRYSISQSFSAAVLVRPSQITTGANNTKAVWGKGSAVWGVQSWSIHLNKDAGSAWVGEFFDAAFAFYGVNSTVVASVDRTDMIVLVYDRPNATLKIWVNGILRATAVHSAAVRNDSTYQMRVASPEIAGDIEFKVGMQAFWTRALSNQEVMRLSTDPFTMWKHTHREFMFGPGKGFVPPPAPGILDNSCCCPACSGISFFGL